ncbi:MAG: Beta-barrel assembly-enhancing protease [bacterium]|nr:Beta-barrel assembly-enhancing protease [bacterium]
MKFTPFLCFFVISSGAWCVPDEGTSASPQAATTEYYVEGLGERPKVVDQVLTATDQARLRHRQLLAQGLLEIREGKFAEAMKTLEASLEANPNSSVVLVQLAELCFRDDTPRAQAYLDRASQVDPDYYRLHLIQAQVHQKGGKFEAMLASLNRCLELSPGQSLARKLRADFLQGQTNSPESLRMAIDDYMILQQAIPQQALFLSFYIGRCYYHLKEYERALKHLEPVIGTPLGAQAAYYVGLCKQELGKYEEALDYLSRIRGNPMANESVARIALIQAESATGEMRLNYQARALEELTLLLKNSAYRARPDQYLTAGRLALEVGLPQAAVQYLDEYLGKFPEDKEAKFLLLRSLMLEGNPANEGRIEELYKAHLLTTSATESLPIRRQYLDYLVQARKWESLEPELAEYERLIGKDGEIALLRARIAFGRERYGEAVDCAKRALDYLPKQRDEIEILIGSAYLQSASLERAREAFEVAIGSASDSLKGLRCLEVGNLYHEREMLREKVEYWDRALTFNPNNQRLRYEIGMALLRAGSSEEAFPYFDVISRDSKESNLRSQADTIKAYLSVVRGATAEAERFYRQALDTWPANPSALKGLAHLMSDQERYEEARDAFQRAVAQEPNDATLQIQLGIVCDKLNDVPAAEEAAQAAMRADPDYAEGYNFLAYMYAERDIKLERALELVETALRLEPSNPNITDTLGWIYFKMGDYSKATEALEKAVSLLTEDFEAGSSVIFEHLGDAHEKLGKLPEAREMWQRAAEGNPKSETAIEKLKRTESLKGTKDAEDSPTGKRQSSNP